MNFEKKQLAGFSLMELIIAITILAILVAITVPVYNTYIKKSRRSDAINTLLAMQLAQEKYRLTHSTYGSLTNIWGGVTTSQESYYSLSISNVSATTYTLTASAGSQQTSDSEDGTSCATMTLTYANGTTTKTPAVCWLND